MAVRLPLSPPRLPSLDRRVRAVFEPRPRADPRRILPADSPQYYELYRRSTLGMTLTDALDEMVAPEARLTPPAGAARRHVMKVTAVGVGAMEKAQWAFYELRFHPEDKVHEPWIAHNEAQALGGLGYLDGLAKDAGDDGWLAGTERLGQADITGVVAYSFTQAVRPNLEVGDKLPHLARFAARCEAMEIFQAAPLG